jgi:ribonucleoside-diphosphate reductase alpha chain
VPLRDLVNKFSHLRYEPAGFTTNRDIPMAKSLVDYIFRYMATKFLSRDEQDVVGIINRQMSLSEAPVVSGDASPDATTARGSATLAGAAPDTASSREEAAQEGSDVARDEAATTSGSSTSDEGPQAAPEAEAKFLDAFQVLAKNGHAKADARGERLEAGQAPVIFDTADSPACFECGSIMVRNGSCYKCINCGSTSGCS